MSLSRTTIRGILLGIILLTIPCYICGIGIWASSPERNQPRQTNTPLDSGATNTPIDPFDLATRTAVGTAGATSTSIFEQPTTRPGFTPIVPTIQIFPTFTSIPSLTPIPTNTVPPTVPPTQPPTSVPLPTDTPVIILPPTDTPNP